MQIGGTTQEGNAGGCEDTTRTTTIVIINIIVIVCHTTCVDAIVVPTG